MLFLFAFFFNSNMLRIKILGQNPQEKKQRAYNQRYSAEIVFFENEMMQLKITWQGISIINSTSAYLVDFENFKTIKFTIPGAFH